MNTEKEVVIQKGRINYGDLVILYEGGDSVKYFTLEKGKDFQNKFGRFKHDDMYNQYFGKRIYNTKNDKFVTILSFVPNIWERCINKMTQILFNPDISLIMTLLNISQSSVIYESVKFCFMHKDKASARDSLSSTLVKINPLRPIELKCS